MCAFYILMCTFYRNGCGKQIKQMKSFSVPLIRFRTTLLISKISQKDTFIEI